MQYISRLLRLLLAPASIDKTVAISASNIEAIEKIQLDHSWSGRWFFNSSRKLSRLASQLSQNYKKLYRFYGANIGVQRKKDIEQMQERISNTLENILRKESHVLSDKIKDYEEKKQILQTNMSIWISASKQISDTCPVVARVKDNYEQYLGLLRNTQQEGMGYSPEAVVFKHTIWKDLESAKNTFIFFQDCLWVTTKETVERCINDVITAEDNDEGIISLPHMFAKADNARLELTEVEGRLVALKEGGYIKLIKKYADLNANRAGGVTGGDLCKLKKAIKRVDGALKMIEKITLDIDERIMADKRCRHPSKSVKMMTPLICEQVHRLIAKNKLMTAWRKLHPYVIGVQLKPDSRAAHC